jgi:hypothetical protein
VAGHLAHSERLIALFSLNSQGLGLIMGLIAIVAGIFILLGR